MVTKNTTYEVEGKIFDDYLEAIKYEEKLRQERIKSFDPNDNVKSYQRIGENILNKFEFPAYILEETKYGKNVYLVNSAEDVGSLSLFILTQRAEEGYWYDGEDAVTANKITEDANEVAAFAFLENRSDFEYEKIELNNFDKLEV